VGVLKGQCYFVLSPCDYADVVIRIQMLAFRSPELAASSQKQRKWQTKRPLNRGTTELGDEFVR